MPLHCRSRCCAQYAQFPNIFSNSRSNGLDWLSTSRPPSVVAYENYSEVVVPQLLIALMAAACLPAACVNDNGGTFNCFKIYAACTLASGQDGNLLP